MPGFSTLTSLDISWHIGYGSRLMMINAPMGPHIWFFLLAKPSILDVQQCVEQDSDGDITSIITDKRFPWLKISTLQIGLVWHLWFRDFCSSAPHLCLCIDLCHSHVLGDTFPRFLPTNLASLGFSATILIPCVSPSVHILSHDTARISITISHTRQNPQILSPQLPSIWAGDLDFVGGHFSRESLLGGPFSKEA